MGTIKAIWRVVYGAWMRFAHLLGTVNRLVFMTLFYWVIIDVTNLILRVIRADLLDRRMRTEATYWHPRQHPGGTYKHQF